MFGFAEKALDVPRHAFCALCLAWAMPACAPPAPPATPGAKAPGRPAATAPNAEPAAPKAPEPPKTPCQDRPAIELTLAGEALLLGERRLATLGEQKSGLGAALRDAIGACDDSARVGRYVLRTDDKVPFGQLAVVTNAMGWLGFREVTWVTPAGSLSFASGLAPERRKKATGRWISINASPDPADTRWVLGEWRRASETEDASTLERDDTVAPGAVDARLRASCTPRDPCLGVALAVRDEAPGAVVRDVARSFRAASGDAMPVVVLLAASSLLALPYAFGPGPSGRLPPAVIQKIVRANFGVFRRCYEAGLARNPKLTGRVDTRFVIGVDGKVATVENAGSTLPDVEAARCVVQSFAGLRFPIPDGGIVTVVYPISFAPGGRSASR